MASSFFEGIRTSAIVDSPAIEFALDAAKIALLVWLSYLAIRWLGSRFAARRFDERRAVLLVLLSAALIAIKITEDAVTGESSEVDRALLMWLHAHTSPALSRAAGVVTLSGSWKVLVPLAALCTGGLLFLRRRGEALYLAAVAVAGMVVTFILKTVIGRERPALWEHDWYWGASFPSGHTLNTTCLAAALAVCIARVWPKAGWLAAALAAVWVLLVALSRMVLGVHWPTDVAAAASIGMALTTLLQVFLKGGR